MGVSFLLPFQKRIQVVKQMPAVLYHDETRQEIDILKECKTVPFTLNFLAYYTYSNNVFVATGEYSSQIQVVDDILKIVLFLLDSNLVKYF